MAAPQGSQIRSKRDILGGTDRTAERSLQMDIICSFYFFLPAGVFFSVPLQSALLSSSFSFFFGILFFCLYVFLFFCLFSPGHPSRYISIIRSAPTAQNDAARAPSSQRYQFSRQCGGHIQFDLPCLDKTERNGLQRHQNPGNE